MGKHRSLLVHLRRYSLIFVVLVILISLIRKAVQLLYLQEIGWEMISFSWISIVLALFGSLAYLVFSLFERESGFRRVHIFIAVIAIIYSLVLLVAKVREIIVIGGVLG